MAATAVALLTSPSAPLALFGSHAPPAPLAQNCEWAARMTPRREAAGMKEIHFIGEIGGRRQTVGFIAHSINFEKRIEFATTREA